MPAARKVDHVSVAKSLNSSILEFQRANTKLETLAKNYGTELQEILTNIAANEEKLASLEDAYAEKKRIADVDLDLAIRADKEKAYITLCKELKMAQVTELEHKNVVGECQVLTAKLANVQAEMEAEHLKKQKAAISAAVRNAEHESKITITKLEADIASAHREITALQHTIEENKAVVAQALRTAETIGSAQQVTINTAK